MTEKRNPPVPVEWLKQEWRNRRLSRSTTLTISEGCLGPCVLANVVCITSPHGVVWFGQIEHHLHYTQLVDWAEAVARTDALLPLPSGFDSHRFDRFRSPSFRLPKKQADVNCGASPRQVFAGQVTVVQRYCIDVSLMAVGVEGSATGWRSSARTFRRIETADLRKIWSETGAMTDSAPILGTVPQTVIFRPISKEHTMKTLSITLVITAVLICASCQSHKEIAAAKPVNPHCRCVVENAYYENPIQPAASGKMPASYVAPGNTVCPCGIDNSDQG